MNAGTISRRRADAAKAGDGVLAWSVLRKVADYEEAWLRHGADATESEAEPGPFRIRVQTEVDLEARRFELLAWQDPFRDGGASSPFWLGGMVDGSLDPGAEPLAAMAGDGASIEGLRLLGGALVLKVECGGAAVQVRLRDAGRFPEGGGVAVSHSFGLRLPHTMDRLLDFWSVVGRPAPRDGTGPAVGFAIWTGWSR